MLCFALCRWKQATVTWERSVPNCYADMTKPSVSQHHWTPFVLHFCSLVLLNRVFTRTKFRPFICNQIQILESGCEVASTTLMVLLVLCAGMGRVLRLLGHDAGLLRRRGTQVLPLPVAQHLQGRSPRPPVASGRQIIAVDSSVVDLCLHESAAKIHDAVSL